MTDTESNRPEGAVSAIASMIAGIVALASAIALGVTLLIPVFFSWLAYLAAARLDKRLLSTGQTFGGFGKSDSSAETFRLAVATEVGHLALGIVSIGLSLSGLTSALQPGTGVLIFVELGVFLALVIAFVAKPSSWSILLLCIYHIICVANMSRLLGQLPDLSQQLEDALIRSYSTHIIFHGAALLLIGWYSFVRVKLGDTRIAIWRTSAANAATSSASPPERLAQLSMLRAQGLITDSDYEAKKADILREL